MYNLKGLGMSKTQAPESMGVANNFHRNEMRFRAYFFIKSAKDQRISNRALAILLKMDPRGLRQVLEKDKHFQIQLCGENHRTEPWYTVNPNIPPIDFDDGRKSGPIQATITAGEVVKLTKGKS